MRKLGENQVVEFLTAGLGKGAQAGEGRKRQGRGSAKGRFHRVEGFNVRQLDLEGALPGVPHSQQNESVEENGEHGAVFALFIKILSPVKIDGAKFFRAVGA